MLKTPETKNNTAQEQLCYIRGQRHAVIEIWKSVLNKQAPPVVVVQPLDKSGE